MKTVIAYSITLFAAVIISQLILSYTSDYLSYVVSFETGVIIGLIGWEVRGMI